MPSLPSGDLKGTSLEELSGGGGGQNPTPQFPGGQKNSSLDMVEEQGIDMLARWQFVRKDFHTTHT